MKIRWTDERDAALKGTMSDLAPVRSAMRRGRVAVHWWTLVADHLRRHHGITASAEACDRRASRLNYQRNQSTVADPCGICGEYCGDLSHDPIHAEQHLLWTDLLALLNTGDIQRLRSLPRIGKAKAEKIIAHRKVHGPYREVGDLLHVSGVGLAWLPTYALGARESHQWMPTRDAARTLGLSPRGLHSRGLTKRKVGRTMYYLLPDPPDGLLLTGDVADVADVATKGNGAASSVVTTVRDSILADSAAAVSALAPAPFDGEKFLLAIRAMMVNLRPPGSDLSLLEHEIEAAEASLRAALSHLQRVSDVVSIMAQRSD